jgi:MFS family permease
MSDVFSRPSVCYIILISYVVGFVMLLKSPNLATYIVGQVFVSIGGAGLGLLSSVITADLVSLKWRGFAQGVLSTPYIVIPCKSFPNSFPFSVCIADYLLLFPPYRVLCLHLRQPC